MSNERLNPRLIVAGAAEAIDFYVSAFGAKEIMRYADLAGKIVHAELAIGGAGLTLKDEDPGSTDLAPTSLGGTLVLLTLKVGARMREAGAEVVYAIGDTPYGQRMGRLADPFGHVWMITQDIE